MKLKKYLSLFVVLFILALINGCDKPITEPQVLSIPTCSIKVPLLNEELSRGQKHTLIVQANDADNTIKKVEFYLNNKFLGSSIEKNAGDGFYHLDQTFAEYPHGSYKLKAVAIDTDNLEDSSIVNIKIINNAPTTVNKIRIYESGKSLLIDALKIDDVNTGDTLTTSIAVIDTSKGFLQVTGSAKIKKLDLVGSLEAVNTSLEKLNLVPNASTKGNIELRFTVKDNSNKTGYDIIDTLVFTQKSAITVSSSSLRFGNVTKNTTSVNQPLIITGVNLKDSITITTTDGFDITKSGSRSTKRGNSLKIPASGGIINVVFNPTDEKAYSGKITITSETLTQEITISGTGTSVPTPNITVNPKTLLFDETRINTTSIAKTINVTGSNFTGNITVTAPAGFEITTTQLGKRTNTRSVTLPSTGGIISVLFKPIAVQGYVGEISFSANGVTEKAVVCGTGTSIPTPNITVNPDILSFGEVTINTISTPQMIDVKGSNFTGNITVTAPAGFEVATIQLGKRTNTRSVTLPSTGGIVYVTFKPTAVAPYSSGISFTASGVTKTALVSGIGKGLPAITLGSSVLNFGYVPVGSSSTKSFSISGSSLMGDITVTAPADYSLAVSSTTRVKRNSRNSITIPNNNGTGSPTNINVTFTPTVEKLYDANMVNCTSPNATTKTVTLNGSSTTSGNFEWVKQVGGAGRDVGQDIAVDQYGNSYICGYFEGTATFGSITLTSNSSSGSNAFVAKMDNTGKFLWAKKAGSNTGGEVAWRIVVDQSGNSYITGMFMGTAIFGDFLLTSTAYNDVFIAKIDTNGNFIWAKSVEGTGHDSGSGICADNKGNVYVSGIIGLSASFGAIKLTALDGADAFVAKLDKDGNFVWAKRAGSSNGNDGGGSIDVDANENVYIAGNIAGNADFGSLTLTTDVACGFIAKLNSNGSFLWTKKIQGGSAIRVNNQGYIYCTGNFTNKANFGTIELLSSGVEDLFVAKADSEGNFLWAKRAGGASHESGLSIDIDSQGNSYIAGYFASNTSIYGNTSLTLAGVEDVLIAKIDKDGNFVWAKRAGGTNEEEAQAIAIDSNGNGYVIGCFIDSTIIGIPMTSAGSRDTFILKMNLNNR